LRREHIYVYALLEERTSAPRVSGHRVEVIDIGGVAVAAERLAEAPALSEAALRDQHRVVVRLAGAAPSILPVRFGSFVERAELERVLRSRAAMLREAFHEVRGKTQMTVRVFGPVEPAPTRPEPRSGTEYLRARAASNTPRLSPIARAVSEAVRPLVSAERVDAGRGGVQITLNHLIARGRARRYRSSVDVAVGAEAASSVVVSGPWPPFAFAPDLWSSDLPLDRLIS
jgi:hypothetical protein